MNYDALTILKLIWQTLLPVVLAAVLYFAERRTKFGNINYRLRQAIIGILFGGVAVTATAFGIPIEGAVLNIRNAAPLTAGLLFGGPAGIIAGVIGGVYRWFAVYFGAGEFSRLACTIGCILAGFFGAGCRKFMFDNKKASWFYGFVIGGVTEVLHMLLVFITNMDDVYGAYRVVAVCAVPMILCNAVSVMLSLFLIAFIGKERTKKPMKNRQISQIFQFLLLICVIVAFTATTAFTSSLQTRIAYANADSLLELNLRDVERDIEKTESADDIRKAVVNRHIGKEGGIIVCDNEGSIIYDNGGHTGESIYTFKDANEIKASPGIRFTANIGSTKSYCMFSMADGLYLIAYIPVSEAMFSRNIAVTILAFMETIVFAALFVHIYFLIKKLIVDNIHKINGSLAQITEGNLNVHINVRENEEFASLSDDINATVDTLKRYISEAESRMDKELEFARQIQHSALPSVFPPYPERKDFDIFASMNAAKEVGGDFYDFCLTDSGRLMFLVADVSGKGIPGALFMMRAKTTVKNLVESGKEIDEVFTEANKRLCENNEAEMFVTAWMGLLDTETGLLQYVNAGHNPPLIRHGNGCFEYLRTKPNFILAGMDGTKYKKQEIRLERGDEIYLYTDGVTEAADTENRLYGEERLKAVLSKVHGRPEELCKTVGADIEKFTKGAEQSDDITMLCVKLNSDEREAKTEVSPNAHSIETVVDFLTQTLEKWKLPAKLANKVQIAVDEIYSNIVYYSGAESAVIALYDKDDKLTVCFTDDGKPYDPTTAKEPDITLNAEQREIGGLGIFMVKKLASEIRYRNENGKNILSVEFTKL